MSDHSLSSKEWLEQNKDDLIEMGLFLAASIFFGLWQHSIFAGLFFICAFFLYNRLHQY